MGPSLWQVLGKEDTFPLFCVLIMVTGVLSYILAVYQIFLGLEEDKVVTGSSEEAGVEMESMTMAREDIRAGVGGLGQCSLNNASVWSEVGRGNGDSHFRRSCRPLVEDCVSNIGLG